MTLAFRRILFGIFIALFLLIGVGAVYYSQGYRFDFSTFSIRKTGAVYVETNPKGIQIYLGSEEYQDKSGIFSGGTLLSNIIPRRYRITIKKDGYYDYEKNIEVLPSQVVRLINIQLIPQKISPRILAANIKGDSIADISSGGQILTVDSKTGTYYSLDPSQTQSPQINVSSKISALTKQKTRQVLFYPQTSTSFIITTAKGVYRADTSAKTLTTVQTGDPVMIKVGKNNLYMLMPTLTASAKIAPTSTSMEIFDLVLNSQISEFTIPFSPASIKSFDIGNGNLSILLNNGALWLYDLSGNPITQVAHSAKQAGFSDDNTKLFYQDSDGKTFVYLMDDEFVALNLGKGQSLRLGLIDSANINNIWWFPDSFHLILQYPDRITVAEVTASEPNEQFPIVTQAGYSFYNSPSQTLYMLSQGKLELYDIGAL